MSDEYKPLAKDIIDFCDASRHAPHDGRVIVVSSKLAIFDIRKSDRKKPHIHRDALGRFGGTCGRFAKINAPSWLSVLRWGMTVVEKANKKHISNATRCPVCTSKMSHGDNCKECHGSPAFVGMERQSDQVVPYRACR